MKEEEYIQYNDKDLLRFMQFLVKIELEEEIKKLIMAL